MCIEALFLFQISQIRSLALLIFGHEVTQAVLRRLIISSETRCGIVAQGMTNPRNHAFSRDIWLLTAVDTAAVAWIYV